LAIAVDQGEGLGLSPGFQMKKQIKVKPNAEQSKVVDAEDGSLVVHLKSPPVDCAIGQVI